MTDARADAIPPASPLDQDFSRPGRKPGRRSGWRLVRGAWRLLSYQGFPGAGRDAVVLRLIFAGAQRPAGDQGDHRRRAAAEAGRPDRRTARSDRSARHAVGRSVPHEYRLRDLVRAIDAAKDDGRVKLLVLDLDAFGRGVSGDPSGGRRRDPAFPQGRQAGAGLCHRLYRRRLSPGRAMPAKSGSIRWAARFSRAGGNQLYYKGLIDKLGVTTHV